MVLRLERDPRAARVLAVQRQASRTGALAARPDTHARVRVGGRLSRGGRTPGPRARRRALVAAQVSAHRRGAACRVGGTPRRAGAAPRAVPPATEVGRSRAARRRSSDPGLPLGRSRRPQTGSLGTRARTRPAVPREVPALFSVTTKRARVGGLDLPKA